MAAAKRKGRTQQHTGSAYIPSGGTYGSTYGNTAFELQPEYAPYRIREEGEQRQKEAERLDRAEAREKRIFCAKMIAVVIILFAGCIAFMGMKVMVDNEEISLRKQKSTLADLKSTNAILQAEMTEQLDMDFIKQEATQRLGMSEPQSYQIVYIDVPKQSYTVQYAAEEAETKGNSFLSKLTNILKKD